MLSTAQTDDRDPDDPIDMTYYSDKDFKGYFDDGDSPEYDVTLGNGWCTNLREPRRMGDKHSSIKVINQDYVCAVFETGCSDDDGWAVIPQDKRDPKIAAIRDWKGPFNYEAFQCWMSNVADERIASGNQSTRYIVV
ncbi:hypothetical protein PMZ80_010252 [Knufia obscura]|uniref:Uncharacterized protein n=2 Tax=Knufia TaxID=430999 RepID=A0AAN8EFL7_9EURO|nr:hypothetical protein PMZ80_010252 [Knufia obscura]KAK5952990.1 hypothetical protein OHC33_006111 [Knufia fluminis]